VAVMVYCTKCGAENEDEAKECKECGAPLHPPPYRAYRRRYEDDVCLGGRRGVPIWGIIFGIAIILWGVATLLEDVYSWASWDRLWPFLVIAVGLIIIFNALSRR